MVPTEECVGEVFENSVEFSPLEPSTSIVVDETSKSSSIWGPSKTISKACDSIAAVLFRLLRDAVLVQKHVCEGVQPRRVDS